MVLEACHNHFSQVHAIGVLLVSYEGPANFIRIYGHMGRFLEVLSCLGLSWVSGRVSLVHPISVPFVSHKCPISVLLMH